MPAFLPTSRLRVQERNGKFFVRPQCQEGHFDGPAFKWLEQLPEKKKVNAGLFTGWLIPANDTSAGVMAQWGSQMMFEGELPRAMYTRLLLLSKKQEVNAKRTLAMKEELERWACVLKEGREASYICQVSTTPDTYMMLHQRVAYDNAHGTDGHALFKEQGTGKTLVVIRRILKEAQAKVGDLYRAIVVCPNNVRHNWVRELWAFNQDMEVGGDAVVLQGDLIKRVGALTRVLRNRPGKRFAVVVVSYDTLIAAWDSIKLIQWDLASLDESHYIKNPRAQRTRYALLLRDKANARMALTGTPVSNHIGDLYPQLEFLGEGYSGFTTAKAFRQFFNKSVKLPDGSEKLTELQRVPVLKERLARLSTIVRKHEALPLLPPKSYDVVSVDMAPQQEKVYRELASKLAVEIEEDLERDDGRNRQLLVQNVLTKLLRLSQITSGYVTWDGVYSDEGEELQPKEIEYVNPNPKLEALVRLLKQTDEPDRKWIVWACWTPNIEQIVPRLEREGFGTVTYYGQTQDREYSEWSFNNERKTRVLVGNPQTGAEGLTLLGYDPKADNPDTTNCDHLVYYSSRWSMVDRSQSEDRPHRKGTRLPVRVSDLLVFGTVEEQIHKRVMQKRKDALDIQEVREILQHLAEGIR